MGTDIIPLDTLAATIKAHVAKGDASIEKAEQHYKAAGIHLMEAKERIAVTPGLTWTAFLNSHCAIRRRRADELIALADGRTTLAEMRGKNRERVAAHRERKKSESALRNAKPERIAAAQANQPATPSPDSLVALMSAWDSADRETRHEFMRQACLVSKSSLDDAALELLILRNQPIPGGLAESRWYNLGLEPPAEAVTPYTASEKRQYHYKVDKKTGKLIKVDGPCFDMAQLEELERKLSEFAVEPKADDTLNEDQIPAFLKKKAA